MHNIAVQHCRLHYVIGQELCSSSFAVVMCCRGQELCSSCTMFSDRSYAPVRVQLSCVVADRSYAPVRLQLKQSKYSCTNSISTWISRINLKIKKNKWTCCSWNRISLHVLSSHSKQQILNISDVNTELENQTSKTAHYKPIQVQS